MTSAAKHLSVVHSSDFYCKECHKVSTAPFLPSWAVAEGFEPTPRCKNDDCTTQWWNKPQKPLIDQIGDLIQLQALAKKG